MSARLIDLALVAMMLAACGRVNFDGSDASVDTSIDSADIGIDGNMDGGTAFVPSNFGSVVPIDAGSGTLDIGIDAFVYWVANTETGEILAYDGPDIGSASSTTIRAAGTGEDSVSGIYFVLIPGASAPNVGVFASQELRIRSGAFLHGVGAAALALYSQGDVLIEGTISVAADTLGTFGPGPGGYPGANIGATAGFGPGAGQAGSDSGGSYTSGGGGASFGGTGGAGGIGTDFFNPVAGGTSGSTYGNVELVPLVGGSGGGSGGFTAGRGGNGGGAVQITSLLSITLALGSVIDACGGGGEGTLDGNQGAGSGGGSGGSVLLESPVVSISGFIGANGGSGSRGADFDNAGMNGSAGTPLTAPVLGPPAQNGNGGGGSGSDDTGNAVNGEDESDGGGGGGGGGRIRINTESGTENYPAGLLPTMNSGFATVGAID